MFDFQSYEEAHTLEEALALLARGDRTPVAGGTDLLVAIRSGKKPDQRLVGIRRIGELAGIRREPDGRIAIGALVTFSSLEEDGEILRHLPWLARAAGTVGGPQLRNVATLGGNLCNGAASADSAPILLCLNAEVRLLSGSGERILPLSEFYLGPGSVDRRPDELLCEVRIPGGEYGGLAGGYEKFSQRKALDIATIGCAALARTRGAEVTELRLACGVAAPTPRRCPQAEAVAAGRVLTPEVAEEIAAMALLDLEPRDSWRGSREFRVHLIRETFRRMLLRLVGEGGEQDG